MTLTHSSEPLGAALQKTGVKKHISWFSCEQQTCSGARCKYRQPQCNASQSKHKPKSLDGLIHTSNVISRIELHQNEEA